MTKSPCSWHNLTKNPEDLPKHCGRLVELCIARTDCFGEMKKYYCFGFLGYGDFSWYTTDTLYMSKSTCIHDNKLSNKYTVIAWRTITPFME